MSAEKQKVEGGSAGIGTDDTGEHQPPTKLVAQVERANAKPKEDPLLGTVIAGRYRLTKKLGQGGMGVVYKARQESMDRDVAIKLLLQALVDDESLVQRFHLEARAASRLTHPNTITIYDFGQHEAMLYIAMEYLDGEALSAALKAGPMPPSRVISIMLQSLRSLSEAHKKGIVHRDIKPDNIFLTEMGGIHDFVKVLDFGVAKAKSNGEKTLTKAGMIFGTPKYMSPEQARSQNLDGRSDVYALGVMMFQMLMGRVPFDADDHVTILLKHVTEPPPPFDKVRPDLHVPVEFQEIVFRAMAKDVKDRYQSADEMLMALERLAAQFQIPIGTSAYPVMPTGMQPMATASMPQPYAPTPVSGMSATPTPVPEPSPITGEIPNTTGGVTAVRETLPAGRNMDLGITIPPSAENVYTPPVETRSNTGLIIGIAVGAVLLVGITIAVVLALGGGGGEAKPVDDPAKPGSVQAQSADQPKAESTNNAALADKGTTDGGTTGGAEGVATNGAGGETNSADAATNGAGATNGVASKVEEPASVAGAGNDATPPKDDDKKAPVTVTLTSIPPGAQVYEGGELIGTTPTSITRPASTKSSLLTFKLAGFKDNPRGVSFKKSTTVQAILMKSEGAGGEAPKENVKPPGTAAGTSKDEKIPDDLYDEPKKQP